MTLEDLVAAYGVLGNDGKAFRLHWFEIADEGTPSQLIPEDIARQITLFLSDPLARLPTFTRMGALEYPFPVAVKTGTSQGISRRVGGGLQFKIHCRRVDRSPGS